MIESVTSEGREMFRAVCTDCGTDLGTWIGEARAESVVEDHKAGQIRPKCDPKKKEEKK